MFYLQSWCIKICKFLLIRINLNQALWWIQELGKTYNSSEFLFYVFQSIQVAGYKTFISVDYKNFLFLSMKNLNLIMFLDAGKGMSLVLFEMLISCIPLSIYNIL